MLLLHTHNQLSPQKNQLNPFWLFDNRNSYQPYSSVHFHVRSELIAMGSFLFLMFAFIFGKPFFCCKMWSRCNPSTETPNPSIYRQYCKYSYKLSLGFERKMKIQRLCQNIQYSIGWTAAHFPLPVSWCGVSGNAAVFTKNHQAFT